MNAADRLTDASNDELLDELDKRMPLRRANGERLGTFSHRALCRFAFAYHRKEIGELSQQQGFDQMLGAEEAILAYAKNEAVKELATHLADKQRLRGELLSLQQSHDIIAGRLARLHLAVKNLHIAAGDILKEESGEGY